MSGALSSGQLGYFQLDDGRQDSKVQVPQSRQGGEQKTAGKDDGDLTPEMGGQRAKIPVLGSIDGKQQGLHDSRYSESDAGRNPA
jgi:hypothetical protein